jgi:hypothetical protein
MPTTARWEAARNGLPGDLNATNHAAQVDQFLGTHGITPIYEGNQLVTPSGGAFPVPTGAAFTWLTYGTATDFAQPFTMPGGHTAIGRITAPVQPVGNGADLLVSLYPDNGSGAPNTANLLAATMVPAPHLASLTAPSGLGAGGPLTAARFNTLYSTGGLNTVTWGGAAGNINGAAGFASSTTSGNYFINVGGSLVTGGPAANTNDVLTVKFVSSGVLGLPVPQPGLPTTLGDAAVTTTTGSVIVVGGYTYSPSAAALSTVFTASWDSANGVIGSWSTQAALPQALWALCAAASGNTVYVVGGLTNSNALVNTVYWATVNNGQISAWNTTSYPLNIYRPAVAVIQGHLVVAGGATVYGGTTDTAAVYYAAINSDGSLGAWRAGPSIPIPFDTLGTQQSFTFTSHALILLGGVSNTVGTNNFQVLSFDANGPADTWYSVNLGGLSNSTGQIGAFLLGSGEHQVFYLDYSNQSYTYTDAAPVPMVSVPLPASGLTAGGKYHVVLQQKPSQSASDYLQYGITQNALPSDALKSSRHSGTWITARTGFSAPMTVYDRTAGGSVLHTWDDPASTGSSATSNIAARTTTMLYNGYGLPYGVCEATALPNDPLNANPTFTTGTTPWTATNCTLTQSSTQTHGGFPFSGLITPNGTSATVSAQSELVPISAGNALTQGARWYLLNGWLYSPTGWSTVPLSVNWYDRNGTLLSTSSSTVSLTAATWTNETLYFDAPAGAAQAAIVITESGTPAAGNTLYLSNVTLTAAPELAETLAPVSQITYSGSWPPTGVTQLA